jgi:dihydroorotase
MNPPLRSDRDRAAVRQGLTDGTIDVIATDHAPHSSGEKNIAFDLAANGVVGLETSIPISLSLLEDRVISLTQLVEKMAVNPARILGLDTGIDIGKTADITIIDAGRQHCIDAEKFQSLGRNTPFDGWHVKGKAVCTVVDGEIIFMDDGFT